MLHGAPGLSPRLGKDALCFLVLFCKRSFCSVLRRILVEVESGDLILFFVGCSSRTLGDKECWQENCYLVQQ